MDTSLMMVGVSFNSKLVQLEVRASTHNGHNRAVSIPNWFD